MIKTLEYGWPGARDKGDLAYSNIVSSIHKDCIFEAVIRLLPKKEFDITRLHESSEITGSYKIKSDDEEYFLRISERMGDIELESSIYQKLIESGVNVNKSIVIGETITFESGDYRLDIREFLRGNHFQEKESELISLVSELKKFHQALRNYENAHEVQSNQNKINQAHEKQAKDLISELEKSNYEIFFERENWARSHKYWLLESLPFYLEMSKKYLNDKEMQVIHGQIQPGNIIFNNNGANIFDLETTVKSFGNVSWDLAYLFQRFCLINNPTNKEISSRMKIIEEYYPEAMRNIADRMRVISIYNIISAVDYRINDNRLVPEHEFSKFYNLDLQAQEFKN